MEEHAEYYLLKKITNEGRKWRVGKKKKNEAMHQAPRTSHKHLACITTVTSTMHPRLTSQPVFPF